VSQITALIADTSTVGYVGLQVGITGSDSYTSYKIRRNPQNAVARVRTVMNPHIVQEVPGGLISADFTIPAEDAQRWRPMLRYGAYCWLFDGQTPIFMGQLQQPTWTAAGDAQILVDGPWVMLGKSRQREIWELRDFSVWTRSPGSQERRDGSDKLLSDGSLQLSYTPGASVATGKSVSVEYFPPGSSGGGLTLDAPLITGFEVHVSDASFNGDPNLVFRVQAVATPGAAGTTLYSTTATGTSNRQTADNVFGENVGGGFTTGTAGLRVGLFTTGTVATGTGSFVVVDRLRITTRQGLMPANSATQDTAAIARDMLQPRQGTTISGLKLPEAFWPGAITNIGSYDASVKYGRDAVTGTGTAPDSGIGVTGFNILDMTSPSEILMNLAGIDGYHVGFYLPYNGRGGYDAGNVNDTGSLWLSARPQLFYQAWPDPRTNPDYTIQIREGATIEDADQRQQLLNMAYADYQTRKGLLLGSDATDGDPALSISGANTQALNYLSNQGLRVAESWSIEASASSDLADHLTQQMLATRRNPVSAATVTITNDGTTRWPILQDGAQIPHLSIVRPGSVRVVDAPAAGGLRQGYATRVEWWGQTLNEAEHVELTLADPGQMLLERRLAWTALRANRQRVSGG